MSCILGIDLGTTNSAVAILDGTGKPDIVANAEGENITPSAVYFEPGDDRRAVIGTAARNSELLFDGRLFRDFKRRMSSTPYEALHSGGISVSAVELSSLVLRKLLDDARERFGNIDKLVVTTPANFANEARLATIKATELAGHRVDDIINEPTAALFYYSHQQAISGQVLVYDLGGGTLDVTVAQIAQRDVRIVSSKGDPRLGGIDFDLRLQTIIENRFKETTGETFDASVHAMAKTAEDYKKLLTVRDDAAVQITGGSRGRTIFKVTRAEFEAACSTLVAKSALLVESTLDELALTPNSINQVYLVGGSTRMPMVREHLTKLFGRPPVCHVNPDEVVALGAALYAGLRADAGQLNAAQAAVVGDLKLHDVANHFFGTIGIEEDSVTKRMDQRVSTIIRKNEPLPCARTRSYATVGHGQTQVRCCVTQSSTEESDPGFVRVIWEGELGPLPPDRPPGMQVQVTFAYDTNQVMHCTFLDVASGIRKEVRFGIHGDATTPSASIDRFERG